VFRWLWKGIITKKTKEDFSPTKGGKGHGGARFARVHVSQKPVALMRWCIEKLKPPQDGIILDPYLGSGSTGIAALTLGYKFIGCEIDPEHLKIAVARINYWLENNTYDLGAPDPVN
jgi:DNA modification methylase